MFGSKIKLEKELLRRCKEYAASEGYSSVEEFVTHALESALMKAKPTAQEEDKMRERLKGLGYVE
jgi:metal-responsive CopG/Arc/MetJ family transcriptional regulator